jgi:uncharacterized protein YbjT (DUF2867 family)
MIAIVLGATGMTGKELVKQLLNDNYFSQVVLFVRRSSGEIHPKLTEHIVNFDMAHQWQHLVKGDVLFSCMGTTLHKAGNKAAQFKIDYHYQYETARAAATNGVKKYVLISSAGASTKSAFFYSRMKGELDEAVQKLKFKSITILRPGQLYGNREENRKAELFAVKIMFALNRLGILKKYRPLHACSLAKAMINASKKEGNMIYTMHQVHELAYEKL